MKDYFSILDYFCLFPTLGRSPATGRGKPACPGLYVAWQKSMCFQTDSSFRLVCKIRKIHAFFFRIFIFNKVVFYNQYKNDQDLKDHIGFKYLFKTSLIENFYKKFYFRGEIPNLKRKNGPYLDVKLT